MERLNSLMSLKGFEELPSKTKTDLLNLINNNNIELYYEQGTSRRNKSNGGRRYHVRSHHYLTLYPKIGGKCLYNDETKFPKCFYSIEENITGKIVYSTYSKTPLLIEDLKIRNFIAEIESFLKYLDTDFSEYDI